MSLEEIKEEGIAFFSEAIKRWSRLIQLYNEIRMTRHPLSTRTEANDILIWFQENYSKHRKFSNFEVFQTLPDGKTVRVDPVFDVIFRGTNILTIIRNPQEFSGELDQGMAHLRGHLSSIRNLTSLSEESEIEKAPLLRIRKILSRFHLVANQLKRRRKNKMPYLIEDEYDVQDLLHATLRLDFGDIRKEEWTPDCAGAASRIDLVLKKEGILIEVKKTSKNLREKQIGEQLIVDIEKYKEYPGVRTLVCFIYDPEEWIENREGLERDLEKLSTEELNVEVFVCPRSA